MGRINGSEVHIQEQLKKKRVMNWKELNWWMMNTNT